MHPPVKKVYELLTVRELVASCGQFSGIKVVHQTAEEHSNTCSTESAPGYISSKSVCGATQWITLSSSRPKFKFFDLHEMLNNLLQGQRT